MNWTMFVHLLIVISYIDISYGFDLHLRGPTFVMEPPTRLEFSNSSGGWLDCSASGSPQPSIDWLSVDGTSVGDVSGIRRVLRNGTLVLLPFAAAAYRQDIHSTVYRCIASNSIGRIISRDVQVRAVVTQAFNVEVEVLGAARGCTAVLKCVVPSFVKDLVRIVSWVRQPELYIYPSLQGDGKFHQLPSGDLLIHNLDFNDPFSTYRCKAMHRLSKQIVISSPANVRIAEHRGIVSPVIVEHSGTITVPQDEGAALLCIAQGCPAPEYRWYSHSGMEPMLVIPGPRIRQLGPVLAIESVTSEDGGVYRCTASNPGGEASAEIRLMIATSIHVEVTPPLLSIHMGGSAEFRCLVSAQGGPHLVTWFKDGRQLPSTGRGTSEILLISNVGREDRGMYQCIVRRSEGDTAQASAELQLGDAPPVLLYSFIEQTLQPGPAVSLKCSAAGNPTPQISWTLDGFPLPSNGRFVIGQYVTVHGDVISHVNISHVMVEDGGEYTCTAENRAGKTSHSARLNIYGMPYIRLIPKVTAVAGETLQLKCPVAGYPIEEIHWERGGRELPDDLRQKVLPDGTLQINPVEKKADSGVYTCWARNKQGHSARRSGEVAVIVPPKVSPFYAEETLHVGDRASLTCSVTKGDLPLTISWHKDGRVVEPAQMVSVTQVDQYTSILLIENLTPDHNGNYSCVVRNLAAEVSHTQHLVVNVPPIIEPFSFQDGLSEGMRTRTVCGVSSGDQPLVVSWLKDGQPLTPALGVNVSALDSYSSLLSISSLDSRHSGDFTCVASNPAAEVRYTAKLQVKVPPRWLVEPIDVSVERNHHVSLHCQAQGVPTPIVIWKKATGSKSGDYEEIRDQMHTKLLGNGTLLLQHVKENREGFYLCQADNGIGTGIGKVIQLRVNSSPYFSAPSRLVTVKKGDTATLHCDVNGDKPISVNWLRSGKTDLNSSKNYRVHIKQDVTPEGVAAQLQIANADASDSGAYFCQASNMYGRDQQLVQLLVQEPPLSPQHLEAAMTSSRSINLKWQHKSGDSNEVFKFIVEYREVDRPWQYIELTETPLQFAALVEDLKPATRYIFRIIAEGPAGKSKPSAELIVRTEPQRPAGPPLNLSVRPVSSTELLITWSPPLPDLRHGEIQGFNVGYRSLSMGSYNYSSITGDGEDGGGELLLGGLAKYITYSIVVQAFNEVGPGPLTEPFTSQTMEDVPSAPPEDIRCAHLTSQSLQVSWQPPPTEHCNGLLQGYKLTYEPVIDDDWRGTDEPQTRKTTALTTVITGLRKSTNYSIQVLAFTKVGDGMLTSVAYCATEEDIPASPTDIKVVVSSPQSLLISWLPPSEPNGLITKYYLYKRSMDGRKEVDHAKQTISSQQTNYEAKGLQTHIEYQFWVSACTRIGEGQSSRVVSQVPSSRIPARITSFGGQIVRPWRSTVMLSCTSVGSPRREWYRGEYVLKQIADHSQQILDTGELIINNVQLGDSGNYTCQVDNSQGSDKLTYNLLVQVPPDAPLLYVSSATSSSVLLHWKAGSNGRAPISGYTLNYKKERGDLNEVFLSRHITSYELKGLLCGTSYHLYLTAHNKIGSSPASHPLQARTQGHPPGVPTANTFIFPNTTAVILRLHIWPDNGCPLLYFILQYRKASESQWTLVSNALKPQRRTAITGLTSSTQYIVKVVAHNIAGFASEEFVFTTLAKEGDAPPPDLMKRENDALPFYTDLKIIVPVIIIIIIIILLIAGGTIVVCLRSNQEEDAKEQLDNQQNAEAQRERYYATIHKVALQAGEKIPETSEDISPYATFQLSEPSTLPQNTMLHSFMYHEHAITEGCASPPPATSSVQRNSPYYNIQKFQSSKGHGRRRTSRKTDVDSDESDSDPDQLTSSRTESSNQLDMKHKHNFIYHGAQSSTSSDISPMSEQKSLPRRNRSRWLSQGRSSARHLLPTLSVAETPFTERTSSQSETNTPDRLELSEAECDIDTLKKLKLGMRSSLWSRPAGSGHPSDYSIAV